MCGRYGFTTPDKLTKRYYNDLVLPPTATSLRPRYNIAPSQVVPVITALHTLALMQWGLVPFWARDGGRIRPQINARAEGIEDKATFRKAFRLQRCLIPASFFFEWQRTPSGSVPYLFKLKTDDIFSFAGLYDVWRGSDGTELVSCAIITTQPNELIAPIHNRMPVILHSDEEETWLNPDTTEPEQLHRFLKPYPADAMAAYPVSRLVNLPTNDTPEVIKPVS
jgi:putative SOS response-associated peptidase YedK